MSIHPQVIEQDGKKAFAVLPYNEYLAMREAIADFEDLKELRAAKADAENEEPVSLQSVSTEIIDA